MATSYLDKPAGGFGTAFSSMADMRRKVGGGTPSTHPRRMLQQKLRDEREDRERMLAKEGRDIAQQDWNNQFRAEQLKLQALGRFAPRSSTRNTDDINFGMTALGGGQVVAPVMSPTMTASGVATNAPLTPTASGSFTLPTPTLGTVAQPVPMTGSTPLIGGLAPDGRTSFTAPPTAAPVAPVVPANPYAGDVFANSAPVPPGMSAGDYRADMGLRQSAANTQAIANGQAAVQAVKAQQAAAQTPDPWNRQLIDGMAVSTMPTASVVRDANGASLESQYGGGSVSYGAPAPKSFTTIGADGKAYTANSFDKWKQDQIDERAIGRATGRDADLAAAGAAGSKAQGRMAFLDQLEAIAQNANKKKSPV